ncbi:hypothetical protein M0802_009899 [Mischocyttarus mexicanus]|nr:hypothetical protein M0802_009899 [Mischocyttarus mexicanus]
MWFSSRSFGIIMINNTGYGHIAPKTKNGKVVTIFYAVVGIPLMLLCLSNIGDVMASSFRHIIVFYICIRFLYWKVCCYVCTKPPKKRRPRPSLGRSYSARQPGRYDINSRATSFRRSIRLSQRSADGTLGIPEAEYVKKIGNRTEVEDKLEDIEKQPTMITRSLPRRYHSVESGVPQHRSTLSTPYHLSSGHLSPGLDQNRRFYSERMRRSPSNYSNARYHKREASLPRIMSPMGFAMHRRSCTDDIDLDYECYTATDEQERQPIKPVPIWLCVFLVVSYILGGACLFSKWEKWTFLDSAYFCFITLTTIGFGDFVPNKLDAHKGIALCSLYLLFGIALLAMSFNLVQEEVINNVKSVAKSLGILKGSDDEYEDDDDDDDYKYDAEYEDDVDEDEFDERCDDNQRKTYLDDRR